METSQLILQIAGFLNEASVAYYSGKTDLAEQHLRRLRNCLNYYRPPKDAQPCESAKSSNGS